MKELLIVSHSEDYHVHKSVPIFEENKTPYFILNLDKFPKDYEFSQKFIDGKCQTHLKSIEINKHLNFDNIGAVWLRKPAPFAYINSDMEEGFKAFSDKETEHALFGAIYGLSCFWVSHPRNLRASMWKGEQLQRASNFGFTIPNTIISQDPNEIRAFYIEHQKVVYKAMSSDVISHSSGDEQGIATTLVDEGMLEDTNALALTPNMFQAYIEKAYELRVTVINGQVFAAKLDSQVHPETQVDCRNLNVNVPMTQYILPKHIEQACSMFVASYNLNYSALDFIVTPHGDYVFLENNPNGQFMFVEEKVPELGLLNTLANELHKACQ